MVVGRGRAVPLALALLVLIALVASGCGAATVRGAPEPQRQQPRLGQEFTVARGESVRLADADLRVGFDDVLADSRCPQEENIQCVWEGDAVVAVALATTADARAATVELHTNRGFATTAEHDGYLVELVSLTDPARLLTLRIS